MSLHKMNRTRALARILRRLGPSADAYRANGLYLVENRGRIVAHAPSWGALVRLVEGD